ncbi:MAG TPA: hypothetical protein VHJ99_00810 [Candidatus Dormibacteraeota bacterium]|nr:hypothetical protein [Candidatus Dormibacteraeota bacterium]
MSRRFLALAAACAAMVLTARPALADAAPPIVPGDPVGLPSGLVKDVFIEHEDLTMDLSGLNDNTSVDTARAAVLATYTLRNDGDAKNIDLVFVTASQDVSAVEVVLDQVPVVATVGPLGPVPASWMPPAGTPNLLGGPDLPYEVDRPAGLTFRVFLIYGRHTLTTRYRALPTQYSGNAYGYEPHFWQLAFVLSPARQWKGFGDLAITVRVPPGWPAAVHPTLERSGDALTGHFDGVPADAIGVTTRMPTPPDWTQAGWVVSVLVVVIVGVSAGWLLGRPRRWPWLLGVGPFLVTFPAIVITVLEQMRYYSVPAAQMSWSGAKGVGFAAIADTLVAFIVGLILCQIVLTTGATASAMWRKIRHAHF